MKQPGMKGRIGELHPRAKLTDAKAAKLIEDRAAGLTLRECATKYHVSETHVSRICCGRGRKA